MKKTFIIACLSTACFFLGCNNPTESKSSKATEEKEYDMYETSELAALMEKMYIDNLSIKKELENGKIPKSFPEDFYTIHTAEATPDMIKHKATFDGLAKQYLINMEAITQASNNKEAKIAYNEMIMTCASCHQLYCQGPLPKIRKMKIAIDE